MNFIDWGLKLQRIVEVLNDTADHYRYFACTEAASFSISDADGTEVGFGPWTAVALNGSGAATFTTSSLAGC
jgi:hypothetical protein